MCSFDSNDRVSHKNDTIWLLAGSMQRIIPANNVISDEVDQNVQDELDEEHETEPTVAENGVYCIPTWSAYNSLLSEEKQLTEVAALPLIAAPAHEFHTMLVALKQAQGINAFVVGPDRKTVITLDMDLYERAKQLEMVRSDCQGKWILRIGEMHTVLAGLRTVGKYIEDSFFR